MKKIKFSLFFILALSLIIPVFSAEQLDISQDMKFFQEYTKISDVMVVSASKRLQKLADAPAIMTVYTSRQIKEMGFKNMTELLRSIPGMFVHHNDMFISFSSAEAGNSRYLEGDILILIDNMPMFFPTQTSSSFDEYSIPLEIIERVEVIRGPGGVVWGANAFVGLINIITKSADTMLKKNKNQALEVNASIGTWNTNNFSLVFAQQLTENIKLTISGGFSDNNGYKYNYAGLGSFIDLFSPTLLSSTPAPQKSTDTIQRKNKETYLNVKMDYKNFLQLSLYKTGNDYYSPLGDLGDVVTSKDGENYKKTSTEIYRINLNKSLEKYNLEMRLTAFTAYLSQERKLFRYGSELNQLSAFIPIFNVRSNFLFYLNNDRPRTDNADIQFDWSGIDDNVLLLGITYNDQSTPSYLSQRTTSADGDTLFVEPVRVLYEKSKSTIKSFYIQDDAQILDNLKIQAGFRSDRHSLTESVVNPKASVIWKYNSNGSIKFLYSSGFREPAIHYLTSKIGYASYDAYPNGITGHTGDPEYTPLKLKPERSKSYECQMTYNFPDAGVFLGLNTAYTDVRDLIWFRNPVKNDGSFDFDWQIPYNKGKVNIVTFEFEAMKNFPKKFFIMNRGSYAGLNITHNRRKDLKSDGTWFQDLQPAVTYNLFTNIKSTVIERLSFNVKMNGMYYRKQHRANQNYKGVYDFAFGGGENYTVIDFIANYDIKPVISGTSKSEISIGIYNLFDENYFIGSILEDNFGRHWYGNPQPGRSYVLKLSSNF